MKSEMKRFWNRDREWKVKWKCLEIEIEKWNFEIFLENSRETRLSQVTGLWRCFIWCYLFSSAFICCYLFYMLLSVVICFLLSTNPERRTKILKGCLPLAYRNFLKVSWIRVTQGWLKWGNAGTAFRAEQGPCEPSKGLVNKFGEQ